MPEVRRPLATLSRSGTLRLTYIVPCAITGCWGRILLAAVRPRADTSTASSPLWVASTTTSLSNATQMLPRPTPSFQLVPRGACLPPSSGPRLKARTSVQRATLALGSFPRFPRFPSSVNQLVHQTLRPLIWFKHLLSLPCLTGEYSRSNTLDCQVSEVTSVTSRDVSSVVGSYVSTSSRRA